MLVLCGSQITKEAIQNIGCKKIDRCQRRPEFVRDVRKKFLLKARAFLPSLFQYHYDLSPLGHVLHDNGKAATRA